MIGLLASLGVGAAIILFWAWVLLAVTSRLAAAHGDRLRFLNAVDRWARGQPSHVRPLDRSRYPFASDTYPFDWATDCDDDDWFADAEEATR